MRVVAYAFVALALGTVTSGPAAAQCYGRECEDQRSGPPRTYTDRPAYEGPRQSFARPPNDGSRQGFDRPQYRDEPDDDGPRYDRAGDSRSRPWPAASDPGERRPGPSYRRAGPEAPSESYRRFWDYGDRPGRAVKRPAYTRGIAEPQRITTRPKVADSPRSGAGPGRVVISVAEYRSLQNQARELQRLLGRRSDVHERRDVRERRDFRDMPPDAGPRVIYR